MKLTQKIPPRKFEVGWDEKIVMHDCGSVALNPNEQVTFVTTEGGEYDVARKEWGFYATPSLNGRLPRYGLRPVLVRNRISQFFVLLVESGHEAQFDEYVKSEALTIVGWLDDEKVLSSLAEVITEGTKG